MEWMVALIVAGGFAVYFRYRIRRVESALDRHLDDTYSHCAPPRSEAARNFNEIRKGD